MSTLTLWHKRDDGNGSALSLNLVQYGQKEKYKQGYIWMSIARQQGKSFDFDNKLNVKLGLQDIMHVLPRLKARSSKIKLYHTFGDNSKNIYFNKHVKDGKWMGYYLNINKNMVFHFSPEEIEVIRILLEYAIPLIVGWFPLGILRGTSHKLQDKSNEIPTQDISESEDDDFSSEFKDETDEDKVDEFEGETEQSSDIDEDGDDWA